MDTSNEIIISDTLAAMLSKQSKYCEKCRSKEVTFEVEVIPKQSVEIKENDDSTTKLLKSIHTTRQIIKYICIICNNKKYFYDTDDDNNNFEEDLKIYNDVKNIEYKHLKILAFK